MEWITTSSFNTIDIHTMTAAAAPLPEAATHDWNAFFPEELRLPDDKNGQQKLQSKHQNDDPATNNRIVLLEKSSAANNEWNDGISAITMNTHQFRKGGICKSPGENKDYALKKRQLIDNSNINPFHDGEDSFSKREMNISISEAFKRFFSCNADCTSISTDETITAYDAGPMSRARLSTQITVASLSPPLQSLAKLCSYEYLDLKAEHLRIWTKKSNLANGTLNPESCRVNFQIEATDQAKKKYKKELNTLQEMADREIRALEEKLRGFVRTTTDIELLAAQSAVVRKFCIAIAQLAIATSILSPHFTRSHAYKLVIATIDDHPHLLKHIGINRKQFLEHFANATKCTPSDTGPLSESDRADVSPGIQQFKVLVEGLFIRPWDEYLFTMEVNDPHSPEIQNLVEPGPAAALKALDTNAGGSGIPLGKTRSLKNKKAMNKLGDETVKQLQTENKPPVEVQAMVQPTTKKQQTTTKQVSAANSIPTKADTISQPILKKPSGRTQSPPKKRLWVDRVKKMRSKQQHLPADIQANQSRQISTTTSTTQPIARNFSTSRPTSPRPTSPTSKLNFMQLGCAGRTPEEFTLDSETYHVVDETSGDSAGDNESSKKKQGGNVVKKNTRSASPTKKLRPITPTRRTRSKERPRTPRKTRKS